MQPTPSIRLAELVAALSIATDLGTGHPIERALRACVIAVRLGEAMRYDESVLAEIYYVTLLRFAGCAADARHRAAYFDDEIALGPQIDAVELWKAESMLPFLHHHVGSALPPTERALKLQWALETGVTRSAEAAIANCEIARSIAHRLGLGSAIAHALGDAFERWDGGGVPGKARGEQLALSARTAALALDAELFLRLGGVQAMLQMARSRSGGQHDPALVECLCASAHTLCAAVPAPWDAVMAIEPGVRPHLSGPQIDEAVRTIADFTDLRTPWMAGHSTAVAGLSERAARAYGLPEADAVMLRQAGYVHDVGMVATSVSVWDNPGPFTESEWERARLHPYYTERVLARSSALAPIGALAALHHERLDGSGYHRGLPGPLLTPAARLLAAVEVYCNKIEARPHRVALAVEQAADVLRAEAEAGRLDADAVRAVLMAAGHPHDAPALAKTLKAPPANLSDREVEVLRLLAKDLTNKQIAQQLVISPATVDHHIRHIYTKIGCSTRLAATMWAMTQRLV